MLCDRATVLARTYRLSALPSERTMVADLKRFLRLYAAALKARGTVLELETPASAAPVRQRPEAKAAKPAPDSDKRAVRQPTALTRRGLLVVLAAAPVAAIAPAAVRPQHVLGKIEPLPPQNPPTPPLFTIDHIVTRNAKGRHVYAVQVRGSDHRALVGTVVLG